MTQFTTYNSSLESSYPKKAEYLEDDPEIGKE